MGVYKVGARIGRGGMAEVFLAIQEGLGGFEKLVVIKRIRDHLCLNEEFVQMFLDEARLAANLQHPNVVQIHDIGQDENGYFIVMEYLQGETVSFVLGALGDQGNTMPTRLVCRIGSCIAAGLHHAHTATSPLGEPQPIVHRDVTPSNIIVCYNGVPKILDFGVAKVAPQFHETATGTIKGKAPYLAPEQVQEKAVDARTDVFQMGIVLHEMLTGKRLFQGETVHEVMSAVMRAPIPAPSTLNFEVPPLVDQIVLQCLERDPEQRPASADVVRRQLDEAMRELGGTVSDSDVGEWMRAGFEQRFEQRQLLERSCAKLQASPEHQPITRGHRRVESRSRLPTAMALSLLEHGKVVGQNHRWLVAVAAAGILVGAFGLGTLLLDTRRVAPTLKGNPALLHPTAPTFTTRGPSEDPAPHLGRRPNANRTVPRYAVHLRVMPAHAVIEIDGRRVGAGLFDGTLPDDGAAHYVRISAPGFRDEVLWIASETEKVLRLPRDRKHTPPSSGSKARTDSGNDKTMGRATRVRRWRRRAGRDASRIDTHQNISGGAGQGDWSRSQSENTDAWDEGNN